MRNAILVFSTLLILVSFAQAEEAPTSTWTNETEASIVKVSGNTKSENYSLKQKSEYVFDLNKLVAAGRYVNSKAGSTEIGRAWDASLRYERALSDQWSLFVQQTAESDAFAGYVQRDSTDLGAKYFFLKDKEATLFAEAGARSTRVNPVGSASPDTSTSGRAYLEGSRQFNEAVSGKLWVEYLPNGKDADAYLVNYEPSLAVMMTKVFSLKLSYLVKYHNKVTTAGEDKEDSTLTTSVVAKF